MNFQYYKYCIVPQCNSTTIKTPNKLFIYVPNNGKIRKKWLKLARRDDAHSLSTGSRMYFCEDHFDLPKDMINYMEYHIKGTVSQVRMKPGCMPSKFGCQEDRRKQTCSSTEWPYILKKQRKVIIAECLNESKESRTPSSSLIDTSDSSSSEKSSRMPKPKRHFHVSQQIESSQRTSNISESSSGTVNPRIEMPVRRVVSETASLSDNDNVREMEDQELPHVISTSSNVELHNSPNNISDADSPCIKRVSVQQLEFLARCMERFPALALSRAKSREALQLSHRKWRQIASALNNIQPRVTKTGRGWLRYWTDLKFKVRRKYAFTQRFHTGGRSVTLTPFEQRLIRILTDDDGNLLCCGAPEHKTNHVSKDQDTEDSQPAQDPNEEGNSQPAPTEQVDVISAPSNQPLNVEDTVIPNDSPMEDPIGIDKKNIEEIQTDILRFRLKRQKEMHELEMEQMKERHKLEMEILELKKKRLMQEFDRSRQLCLSVERPRRGARSMN